MRALHATVILTTATLIAWVVLCAPVAAGEGEIEGDDPKAQLQRIMDEPLFQRWQRRQMRVGRQEGDAALSWYADLFERIGQRVRDALRWLFDRAAGSPGVAGQRGGVGIGTLMYWLAWAVAGGLILFVLVTLARLLLVRPRGAAATAVSRSRIRDALDKGEALAADSPRWLEESQRLAAGDDLRLAYRAIYLALLSGLHEQRKIDFRRHRTNWTYVSRYRGPADERAMLEELTAVFDQAWYGRRPPDRATFERVRKRVGVLVGSELADA